MDVPISGRNGEEHVPVGIGARQFLEWLDTEPSGTSSVKIQLSAGSKPETAWQCVCNTVGGRIFLCCLAWATSCLVCALLVAPELPSDQPELLFQQVQEQIRMIPLPIDSPHYAFYRRHYLEQYQNLVKDMQDTDAGGVPRLNLPLFLRGMAVGTWLLIVLMAFCEYRYCTISIWIEMLSDWRPVKLSWPSRLQWHRVEDESWVDDEGQNCESGPTNHRRQAGPVAKAVASVEAVKKKPAPSPKKAPKVPVQAKAQGRGDERKAHHSAIPELARPPAGPAPPRQVTAVKALAVRPPAVAEEVTAGLSFEAARVQELVAQGGIDRREATPHKPARGAGDGGGRISPGSGTINKAAADESQPPSQTFVWDDCKCGVRCSRVDSTLTTEASEASGAPSLDGSEDACPPDTGRASEAVEGPTECVVVQADGANEELPNDTVEGPEESRGPSAAEAGPSAVETKAGPSTAEAGPPSVEAGSAERSRHCEETAVQRPVENRQRLREQAAVFRPFDKPPGLDCMFSLEESGKPAAGSDETSAGSELPPNLDSLSTDELIRFFFDGKVREELGRKGVPLRKHLLRCLRMVQDAGGQAGTGPVQNRLRADAPAFTPGSTAFPVASSMAEPPADPLAQAAGWLEGLPQEGFVEALMEGIAMAEAADLGDGDALVWDHLFSLHFNAAATAQWYASQLGSQEP